MVPHISAPTAKSCSTTHAQLAQAQIAPGVTQTVSHNAQAAIMAIT